MTETPEMTDATNAAKTPRRTTTALARDQALQEAERAVEEKRADQKAALAAMSTFWQQFLAAKNDGTSEEDLLKYEQMWEAHRTNADHRSVALRMALERYEIARQIAYPSTPAVHVNMLMDPVTFDIMLLNSPTMINLGEELNILRRRLGLREI